MSQQTPFFEKQAERVVYIFLLISLSTGRIVASTLTLFSFLFKKKKPKKDFLFFPYTHKDNTGTLSRFQIYEPYLKQDGYTYDMEHICDQEEHDDFFFKQSNRIKEYLHYHKTFWKRLFIILSAGNYKAVFIHRGLFPAYYDQFFPYLERLLHKLNSNVTIDFFDADYARNKKLIDTTVFYCDKVCVVNDHLLQYFSHIHPRVSLNDLAIDISPYLKKQNYDLQNPVNIFWTGSPLNGLNLTTIIPILEKINLEIPVKLTMVGKSKAGFTSSLIEHFEWTENTFFQHISEADIAIYPAMEDNEFNRGKVAYKVLDYAAAQVPVVSSPLGLSPHFENGKDVLVANDEHEWEQQILRLIQDSALRKQLADNAYQKLLQYHSVEATYHNLLNILLS